MTSAYSPNKKQQWACRIDHASPKTRDSLGMYGHCQGRIKYCLFHGDADYFAGGDGSIAILVDNSYGIWPNNNSDAYLENFYK